MKILEYNDLDTSRVRRSYQKLIGFLEKDDFYSAEVKKLAGNDLYRAKLDESNRLLFRMMTCRGERYALILEVVLNHAYDRSKFLRGVSVDETKIPIFDQKALPAEGFPSLNYINPSERCFHLLDKILSFDPGQQDIYRLPAPLIIIGPAGSGKTALTLEKMKRVKGQVLYVTLSPYLAENSRNLYYAHHYENENQEISFLSFREYLETLRVPEGREITYRQFAGWLARFPRQQRVSDAHRLYEEFRGVITGSMVDQPWLNREEYMSLGVRQSIYLDQDREPVYNLFQKYLVFLKENNAYDPNILAHEYLPKVAPLYDFVVIDEVQDITNIQLQLILRSLKKPEHFLLCGDSNQIVHPNFFSWSSLKSMLYREEAFEPHKIIRVLVSNFRNSAAITDVSNKLLGIKQKRFGSIDRESNYLMNSMSPEPGEILLLKDTDKVKQELNRKIRRSTRFAVLVMHSEDKAAARSFFDTPLVFSIQEVKGLEYENVVLVNFISGERATFEEIVEGISTEDLQGNLRYMRSGDKRDKSHEVYKFFINSLYVAVTRSVQRLYLIESDPDHPLIGLLGIKEENGGAPIEVKQSSMEEWQLEARRLELQGRQEQADEIRRDILRKQPVPWDICTPERVLHLLDRAGDPKDVSQKPKKILFEYGLFHDDVPLLERLTLCGYDPAKLFFYPQFRIATLNFSPYHQQRTQFLGSCLHRYTGKFFKDILQECEQYGSDYRQVFNKTPLMLAALAGNQALIKALLAIGADPELTDNYGLTAWQGALQRALGDHKYAFDSFGGVHELLAPASISLKVDSRLIKIDSRQGEFLLFHMFLAGLHPRISRMHFFEAFVSAPELTDAVAPMSDSILPAYRKKRAYQSSLLSKNEITGSHPYGKNLFVRKRTGSYVLNPKLAIRHKDVWVDIYRHINLELMKNAGSEKNGIFQATIRALLSDDQEP